MSHNILFPYGKYLWLINTYSYPRNKANQDTCIYIQLVKRLEDVDHCMNTGDS